MLKQVFRIIGFMFYTGLNAQTFTPDSLSFRTDTATLMTVCDCQDAFIQYGKEQYSILLQVKKVGKNSEEAVKLNECICFKIGYSS